MLAQRLFYAFSTPGDNTPEMVEHYARIADVHVEQVHRKASPANK